MTFKKNNIFIYTLRFGEMVTRWAHNPEKVGSIPTAATKIND